MVRVVPPPRSSRQLTPAFRVTVTADAPLAESSTRVPGSALALAVRNCGGGSPAGVLTRSSGPPAPKLAVPIVSTAVPVSTCRVAAEFPSAVRVAVCGPGGADEQAASSPVATALATAT